MDYSKITTNNILTNKRPHKKVYYGEQNTTAKIRRSTPIPKIVQKPPEKTEFNFESSTASTTPVKTITIKLTKKEPLFGSHYKSDAYIYLHNDNPIPIGTTLKMSLDKPHKCYIGNSNVGNIICLSKVVMQTLNAETTYTAIFDNCKKMLLLKFF